MEIMNAAPNARPSAEEPELEAIALQNLISTALGKQPASLLLKNCQLVNVYSGEIYPTDITLQGNRIASIAPNPIIEAEKVIDCKGFYAVPGFADPHMHIETTFVAPPELARVLVPRGTTTLFTDLTDGAYVGGAKAGRMLLDAAKGLPLRVFAEAPSYAPFMPAIQTTGGSIELDDTNEMLEWPETVSIGEVVHQRVLALDKGYIQKIAAYRVRNKRINGHGAGINPQNLDAFAAAGITDEHGCSTYDELLSQLRTGLKPFMVEAPGRHHLAVMLEEVVRRGLDTRNLCLCVDNASIFDIVAEDFGYLDVHVRIALKAGIPPAKVFQMVSFNTALHYGKDHLLGSITPGRLADILLLRELDQFPPAYVLVDGQVVAQDGQPLWEREPRSYPEWALQTVKFHPSITAERFSIPAPANARSARARTIQLPTPDTQAHNKELIVDLPVHHGFIQPDFERDIVPFYVVERYGKNGNVACAFVQGSGLKKGALAVSVSISDSNIVVMGCDAASIMTCLNTLRELNGGFVVAQGNRALATVPLPLLGQMAIQPYEEMLLQVDKALNEAKSLGCTLKNPFLTMASVVLPTVPDLGMSDHGLINAYTGELVNTVIEWS